eukprot:6483756-Prymnesium_polylepis.1
MSSHACDDDRFRSGVIVGGCLMPGTAGCSGHRASVAGERLGAPRAASPTHGVIARGSRFYTFRPARLEPKAMEVEAQ